MRFLDTNLCTADSTNVTASSSDASFPVSNIKHPFRSKRWRSTDDTSEWVKFDFQTTEPVDSVVLLWPKEDGIRLTGSASIRVQANATDVWTSPAVDQALTVDNTYSVASHFFSTDQEYRYWRVVIEDATNPWECVELGVVWIGKSLEIHNAENGFKFNILDRSKVSETEFGHQYVDEYPQQVSVEVNYSLLDYEEAQLIENSYRQNGNREPVLIALDPEEAVFNKNHFLVYGKMSNSFGLDHLIYDILNAPGIRITELS